MYESIIGVDLLVTLILFVWLFVGYRIGNLIFQSTMGKLRYSARLYFLLLNIGLLIVVIKLGITILLWFEFGWLFAQDQMFINFITLLLPFILSVVSSIPTLWKIVRSTATHLQQTVDSDVRKVIAHPRLLIPIQATIMGSVLNFYYTIFAPPLP